MIIGSGKLAPFGLGYDQVVFMNIDVPVHVLASTCMGTIEDRILHHYSADSTTRLYSSPTSSVLLSTFPASEETTVLFYNAPSFIGC